MPEVNKDKNVRLMTEKANNRLAITVDIEDWYHIPSVCGSPFSVYKDVDYFFEKWDKRYDYLTEPTYRVLRLLEKNNVKATFFVVADIAQHYPGLVESIADAGHEIACHGLHHRCKIDPKTKNTLTDRETYEKETKLAKGILEKIAGDKVIGYRAPNAFIAGWMIDSLREMTFRYDSSVSVNSLYNKSDSALKGVSSYPYYPKKGSLEPDGSGDFIEFPWSYWDIWGIKIPTSGGPMLRFLGAHIILKGLIQSLTRGHTVFYFHPLDISREEFPNIGHNRPLYWAIKGKIIEDRICYLLRFLRNKGIPMKPIRDIVE
jgi:peptidoglycan-N-acetylglucosamine deacetylase